MASTTKKGLILSNSERALLMDAHLLDKPTFNDTLVKNKLVDGKTGLPTKRGIQICHKIAERKYQDVWV